MSRSFTGRHMIVAMVSFFAIVIAVNLVMATAATRTFGGTVVDNSYVASQRFNTWLAEARGQARAGWTARIGADGHYLTVESRPGAVVRARVAHPLGRVPERMLRFVERSPGRYVAREPVAPGRWHVRVDLHRGGAQASFVEDMRL